MLANRIEKTPTIYRLKNNGMFKTTATTSASVATAIFSKGGSVPIITKTI